MAVQCSVVDMGPACVNLTGIRGNDRNLLNATIKQNGAPLNLTGMTITAQARKKSTDPDPPALVATVGIIDAVAGKITIAWPGAAVATLLNGSAKWSGAWDLQVDDGTAMDPLTIAAGTFAAESDVTR